MEATTTGRALTSRQREFLRAIHAHTVSQGCYPTFRDLMLALNIKSPNGVTGHVHALRRKGYLGPSGPLARSAMLRPVGMRLEPVFEGDEAGEKLRQALGKE